MMTRTALLLLGSLAPNAARQNPPPSRSTPLHPRRVPGRQEGRLTHIKASPTLPSDTTAKYVAASRDGRHANPLCGLPKPRPPRSGNEPIRSLGRARCPHGFCPERPANPRLVGSPRRRKPQHDPDTLQGGRCRGSAVPRHRPPASGGRPIDPGTTPLGPVGQTGKPRPKDPATHARARRADRVAPCRRTSVHRMVPRTAELRARARPHQPPAGNRKTDARCLRPEPPSIAGRPKSVRICADSCLVHQLPPIYITFVSVARTRHVAVGVDNPCGILNKK